MEENKTPWTNGMTLKQVVKQTIIAALIAHQGNKTQAARALGISIRALRNKINALGLTEFKGRKSYSYRRIQA